MNTTTGTHCTCNKPNYLCLKVDCKTFFFTQSCRTACRRRWASLPIPLFIASKSPNGESNADSISSYYIVLPMCNGNMMINKNYLHSVRIFKTYVLFYTPDALQTITNSDPIKMCKISDQILWSLYVYKLFLKFTPFGF